MASSTETVAGNDRQNATWLGLWLLTVPDFYLIGQPVRYPDRSRSFPGRDFPSQQFCTVFFLQTFGAMFPIESFTKFRFRIRTLDDMPIMQIAVAQPGFACRQSCINSNSLQRSRQFSDSVCVLLLNHLSEIRNMTNIGCDNLPVQRCKRS